jgi:hypothetical protein
VLVSVMPNNGETAAGGCYRMGNHPATSTTVTNARLQRLGYGGFYNYYHWKTEYQGKLF